MTLSIGAQDVKPLVDLYAQAPGGIAHLRDLSQPMSQEVTHISEQNLLR